MKTKLRKFGAGLMAMALAFAGAGAYGATVQVTDQTGLDNALSAAKSGDVIQITQAGEYELNKLGGSGYTLEATVAGVTLQRKKYTTSQPENYVSSCTGLVTLKNIAWDMTVNAYYPHFKNIHAVDCTFTGLLFAEETCIFEHCTFNAIGTEYNLWCYHGPVTFTDCTFNGAGKFLHLYNESNYVGDQLWEVTVDGCTFNSSKKGKAAVNVKARCNSSAMRYDLVVKNCKIAEGGDNFPEASASDTLIVFNKFIQLDQISASVPNVITLTYEGDVIYKDNTVLEVAKKEVEVVTPTVSEEKGITQEIINQIVSNTEVTKVEETGLQAALAEVEELKEKEAVVKVELTEVAPATGVLTYEIKPVVKGEGEAPDEDISAKVAGKPITFRVPLTDAFTKFAKVTHKGETDEISHVEVLGTSGSRFVELTFNHFSEVEFDPELAFPGLPETAVKVADGFYQSAPTYTASTDFYIVSKAGLEYFRDLVNGKDVLDAYIASDCGKSLNRSVMRFSGKTVKLLADINLNNEIWEPISVNSDKDVFCGTFDGGNHVISNLKVVYEGSTSKAGAGLFGYIKNAVTIQNVTIDNADISGFDCVGGVVGISSSSDTVIRNCKLTGSVSITSRSSFVGGIIGHTYAKEISGCSVEATGGTGIYCGGTGIRVGGICGYDQYPEAVLEDCHVENIDIAMAHRYLIGGIVGTVVSGAKVIRCDVEDVNISCNYEPNYGLIVGLVDGSSNLSIVEDCSAVNSTATGKTTEGDDTTKIANTELVGRTGVAGSVGSPSANLVVGSDIDYDGNGKIKGGTFDVLPESAIAEGFVPAVDPNTGKTIVVTDPITGSGTAADPYVISDLKGLEAFRDRVNAGNTYQGKFVKLGADIDFGETVWTEGIGNYAQATLDPVKKYMFCGTFDGAGYVIKNLKIRTVGTKGNGLFSKVYEPCVLKNVVVKNGEVTAVRSESGASNAYTGGIVGHGYASLFDCSFEGAVTGGHQVAGIFGAGGAQLTRCTFKGTVVSSGYWGVGALVGNLQDCVKVEDCTASGSITAEYDHSGPVAIGGLVGSCLYADSIVKGNYSDVSATYNGDEVKNPVIGSYNGDDGGYTAETATFANCEDNSWNVAVYGADPVALNVEANNELAKLADEPRNANLVGSVKDLEYVGSGVVEIAAGSAIADKSPDEIKAAIESDDPTKTVEIVDGKVVVIENIAKIGGAMFPTLSKAFEAAAGMTGSADEPIVIELFPGTIEEGTVKLPSTLKNVKMVGAADKATTIKNTRIMASDGGAWDYENLTFEGAVYENSQFVITGCRASEVCTAKNFAFIGNEFKDIVNADNNAPIHFVVGEGEPVNGLRVEGNVIDGVSGSQNSGIYVTCLTGDFIVRNNTIANCSYREMNIGIITTDGIDDNVVITDNLTYGNYAEMQIYGEGSATTDSVSWNVSYNILDNESTVADSMCLYRTNPEKTTFVLDHNYYRRNPDTNPGSFYLNGTRTAADIENYGVYPFYASYDKEALAAGASVREVLRDLTGAVAAVVSADGTGTNEFNTLSKALTVAQAGEKVILLADTAEENVPLNLEQEIVLNGHAFTGTVDPANVPAGYDSDVVTTPDGKSFIAPAKVEVPIGGGSVIKVRMLDTAENLATVQENGRPLWANKALGIADDFKILPVVERPAAGSKTITIKSNIPDSVLEAAAQQRDGVSVKFQLAKKVGNVGTYVQFGDKKDKPEFAVEADKQEVQTFWKIQVFFEEEY